jgi:hypothetical protein
MALDGEHGIHWHKRSPYARSSVLLRPSAWQAPCRLSDSGGFQIIEASTGSIFEGEDFNLTVDDLATYLRLVEESMVSEKR